MNNSMHHRKNAARVGRIQQRADAGFVATHFPEVASIVISMTYTQRGILKSLPRIVNFFPESSAFFKVDCLSKDCAEGGFDLTRVITAMIGGHRVAAKGDLRCEGSGSIADHSGIVYEVAIQYA